MNNMERVMQVPEWIQKDFKQSESSWGEAHLALPKMLRRRLDDEPLSGAEIGVAYGGMSATLCSEFGKLELLCVDPYIEYDDAMSRPQEEMDQMHDFTTNRLMGLFTGRALVMRVTSMEAVQIAEDEYFDFVYVDGCHTYEATIEDVRHWWSKVKEGGVLCGDDFGADHPGVAQAVKEFSKEVEVPYEVDIPTLWSMKKHTSGMRCAVLNEGELVTSQAANK